MSSLLITQSNTPTDEPTRFPEMTASLNLLLYLFLARFASSSINPWRLGRG